MNKYITNTKGYTLIELLTVITIISILASIAIPHYLAYRDKAKMVSVYTTIRQIMLAQEVYWDEFESYFEITEPITENKPLEITGTSLIILVPRGQKYLVTKTYNDKFEENGYDIVIETDLDRNMDGNKDFYQFSHGPTGDTNYPLLPLSI